MGDVYDRQGRKLGAVNAWSGVYDGFGRKVGHMDIFTSKVYDAEDHFVGTADAFGNARSAAGNLLCRVAFFGSKVQAPDGTVIGSVGIAGAPEPMPDMQWRGAAALLLLCRERKPELVDLVDEYLHSPSPGGRDRLIPYGGKAISTMIPLLVDHVTAFGANVRSRRERESIKAERWAETVMQPLLWPASELVTAIGPPAHWELCRILKQPDQRAQKTAAILLAIAAELSPEIINDVRAFLRQGNTRDSTLAMLLSIVLANGGDAQIQQEIANHARGHYMDVTGWILKTLDTAVLELLAWEQEILF